MRPGTGGLRGAAIFTVLALVAVACDSGESGDGVRAGPTTSSTAAASDTTATDAAAPDTPDDDADGADLPGRWFGGTEDGRLLAVDTATGDEIELARFTDPATVEGSDEPVLDEFLGEVALSADGSTVFFDTCCEPGVGLRYAVPADGSTAHERLGFGTLPTPSPTSGAHAWVELQTLVVGPPQAEDVQRFEPGPGQELPSIFSLSWSPDGERLALEVMVEGRIEIRVFDPTADTSYVDVDGFSASGNVEWTDPAFDADGRVVVEEQRFGDDGFGGETVRGVVLEPGSGEVVDEFAYGDGVSVVDQHSDASGNVFIYVLADGSVHWRTGEGAGGELAGSGFVSAAW